MLQVGTHLVRFSWSAMGFGAMGFEAMASLITASDGCFRNPVQQEVEVEVSMGMGVRVGRGDGARGWRGGHLGADVSSRVAGRSLRVRWCCKRHRCGRFGRVTRSGVELGFGAMAEVTLHVYNVTNSMNVRANSVILGLNQFMRDGIGIGGGCGGR